MPRFVVVEQGPAEKSARVTVEAASAQEAGERMAKAGWKIASVTVEGDFEGPATVEQLRARLAVIEQRLDEISKRPAVRLSFWKVFLAAWLAALAMWPAALLLGKMFE
jgi:hypothetical protein